MGKTLTGKTKIKQAPLQSKAQRKAQESILKGLTPGFKSTLGSFFTQSSPDELQDIFQQSYVQPALMALEQQIAPAIQQRFVDANAGSSSALNQALAQSARDLSTALGSQYGQFVQNQSTQQLQALGVFAPLLTGQTSAPIAQQKQGLLGPLLQAGGALGAGWLMSSKEVKENIRDYQKGMEILRKMAVKQYDYTKEVGGDKDRVGLIAEDLPEELTAVKNGVLNVDLYGLIAVLINSLNQMYDKIVQLESKGDK